MPNLFIVGDSVSAPSRSGAWSVGQGYAAIVAQRAGFTEVNFAVSGATTAEMSPQVTSTISQFAASDAVLIMAGENDIPPTPVASFMTTLDGYCASLIAAGIPANRITLITPFIYQNTTYVNAAPGYLQAVRDIGAARGIPVVDVFDRFSEFTVTRSDVNTLINSDGHPTAAGHVEIANLFSLSQNAASAAYKNPPLGTPPTPTGPPTVTATALSEGSGYSPVLLSSQVSYSDPAGAPAVTWHVQDYLPPGGPVALSLDGAPFPCPGSVSITQAQFSRMSIAQVSATHDLWVVASNGVYWSAPTHFSIDP